MGGENARMGESWCMDGQAQEAVWHVRSSGKVWPLGRAGGQIGRTNQ